VTGVGLSGPDAVASGSAIETVSPLCTRRPAAARFCGVMKLRAPRWSSLPQRPQLLSFSNRPFTSAALSLGVVLPIGLSRFGLLKPVT